MNCKTFAPSVYRLIDLSLKRERPTFTRDDFESDRNLLKDLKDTEIAVLMRAIARFRVGERVVESELTPLIEFYTRNNKDSASRYRALFIRIQQAEEKIHADFFADYVTHVFGESGDDNQNERIRTLKDTYLRTDDPFSKPFKKFFESRLPRILGRLAAPQSWIPAVVRETAALVCYHIFAEGVIAESAYFGFEKALSEQERTADGNESIKERLPILLKGIKMIKKDESTHIGFGVLRLQELLRGDPSSNWYRTTRAAMPGLFLLNCLTNLPALLGILGAVHREHAEDFPFKINRQQLRDEGRRQLRLRLKAVLFGPKS
jgi:ribonucleotide reductase beta subunit family protein with ferritin-like domain